MPLRCFRRSIPLVSLNICVEFTLIALRRINYSVRSYCMLLLKNAGTSCFDELTTESDRVVIKLHWLDNVYLNRRADDFRVCGPFFGQLSFANLACWLATPKRRGIDVRARASDWPGQLSWSVGWVDVRHSPISPLEVVQSAPSLELPAVEP